MRTKEDICNDLKECLQRWPFTELESDEENFFTKLEEFCTLPAEDINQFVLDRSIRTIPNDEGNITLLKMLLWHTDHKVAAKTFIKLIEAGLSITENDLLEIINGFCPSLITELQHALQNSGYYAEKYRPLLENYLAEVERGEAWPDKTVEYSKILQESLEQWPGNTLTYLCKKFLSEHPEIVVDSDTEVPASLEADVDEYEKMKNFTSSL